MAENFKVGETVYAQLYPNAGRVKVRIIDVEGDNGILIEQVSSGKQDKIEPTALYRSAYPPLRVIYGRKD